MLVRFDANPKISDTVLIQFSTTDVDGVTALNPYKVNNVIIYYLDRGIASSSGFSEILDGEQIVTFANAIPVKVYGTDSNPAWLSPDTADAVITKLNFDASGNPLFGVFTLEWTPDLNREGDYFVCWTWEPIIAATPISSYLRFYLQSDTNLTATLPTHATTPGKYEMLMDRYLPEMYKNALSDNDLTPDVINRLNLAVAAAFTDIENRSNQIFSLQDANALNESLLSYLSNLFNWKLKSGDSTLWRRQIKRAIPLYKKKGTLGGLTEALAECGIVLNKVTKYWQVSSTSTLQEAFRIQFNDQDVFVLNKVPLTVDPLNFSLSLLPFNSTVYETLDSSYVTFNVVNGISYMNWVGSFELNKDDILLILYKVNSVANQTIENYIRTLPLADNRSEIIMRDNDICYPKKNWNIRLIADDDAMLSVICPTRHPFAPPVVFGKVRTEFPYSENVYSMDQYNGCCVGSTTVITENGLKKIKDIGNDETILTEYGFKPFLMLKNQGKRPTLNIETKLGRCLSVTLNHRFRIINENGELEWKEASKLEVGDYVLGKKGRNLVPKNHGIDKDLWYLAGFVYGDGYLYKNGIHWLIPEGEEESKELIEKIINNYNAKFCISITTPEKHVTKLKCNKTIFRINSSRQQLPLLGKILPLYQPKGAWKANLPNTIWTSGEEQICSFLRGLFDTDGTVQRSCPQLTTKWLSLATDIQRLFLIIGIISSITSFPVMYNNEKRIYFKLTVCGKDSILLFTEKINFNLSRKKKALENKYLSANVEGKQSTIFCSDRMVIPFADEIMIALIPYNKTICDNHGCEKTKEEKQLLILISNLKQRTQTTIPDNRVKSIFSKVEKHGIKNNYYKFLEDYINNDWFFDRVKEISIGEEEDVYDPLNVEDTESYLSEGLVSHNSTRDSFKQCDIDKDFLDTCACCLSSNISLDLAVTPLTDDRMIESLEIIKEFIPFHAVVHSLNFSGGIEDFLLPPLETINAYINYSLSDNIYSGQRVFNRSIQPYTTSLKRDMLATANNVASSTATGSNLAISLYCPEQNFDEIALDVNNNLFEILSGLNTGTYSVTNNDDHLVDIVGTVPSPYNVSRFPFRLSNLRYNGGGNIIQDDIYSFLDNSTNLASLDIILGKDSATPWKLYIGTGIYAGTYTIQDMIDGVLVILGAGGAVPLSNISYELHDFSNYVKFVSVAGQMKVQRRGRFVTSDDLINHFIIEKGFYLLYSGTQYRINGFKNANECYIDGYSGGTVVGIPSLNIYKRLVDNGIGYVSIRGMKLETTINYYNTLNVSAALEDDQHIENFLVLIGVNYYQIASWSNVANGHGKYEIVLNGTPLIQWGTSGVAGVSFSIIQFLKTSNVTITTTYPVLDVEVLGRVDRRSMELVMPDIDAPGADLAMAVLNSANNGQPIDIVSQTEGITFTIEYLE